MSELIDTTEMYLRTLYELLEEGIDLRRARIVDRLHQSGPTVSQTVSRMERDGLVVLHRDRSLGLTQTGHDRAQAVMRRIDSDRMRSQGAVVLADQPIF